MAIDYLFIYTHNTI